MLSQCHTTSLLSIIHSMLVKEQDLLFPKESLLDNILKLKYIILHLLIQAPGNRGITQFVEFIKEYYTLIFLVSIIRVKEF